MAVLFLLFWEGSLREIGTGIGADGAIQIAEALKVNASLTVLNLTGK